MEAQREAHFVVRASAIVRSVETARLQSKQFLELVKEAHDKLHGMADPVSGRLSA